MSGDSTAQPDVDDVRSDFERLVKHTSMDESFVTERVSIVQTHLDNYEQAETERERTDVLSELESEIESLRDDIEDELEAGTERAHELVVEIERKIENL